jgi:sugar lactone lactonase YvrE
MRRFLTLVCLLCLAIPAGISISGCTSNPAASYCNGLGYGLKTSAVATITLSPATTGISLAFGQTQQVATPSALTCKNVAARVSSYTYGTTNSQLVDISPTGNICAGTWNRNTGGGVADYSICSAPSPLPSTGGLPYGTAQITALADSVTSNPVDVFVHAQVTSVNLVTQPLTGTAQQCFSQNTTATLDAQACYGSAQNELCAPSSLSPSSYTCKGGLASGVASVPSCTASIGTLTYTVGTSAIASISTNTTSNVATITAGQPGTTLITASVAGSGSSAGYFSTCPPKSISLTLPNGNTSGTITPSSPQTLVTTVTDTNGATITGLALDYQSTDPIDISVASTGTVTTSYPGVASVYAVCQPSTCNPAPSNVIGLYGTGLPLSSNPVTVTTPGTASDYVWYAAPGQSQYFVPVDLFTGTVGTATELPYVPNSMVMDRLGNSLYFGSSTELMIYSTASGTLTTQNANFPGVVLAVSPNNSTVLINDQPSQTFYLYNVSTGTAAATFGGLGSAAAWTPDSKTLYITDSAALGGSHTDTLYVYNVSTNETTYDLSATTGGSKSLAITIPSVGAYLSGSAGYDTVAHTWCPTGTVGDSASMIFYPQPASDSFAVQTDALAATTDGQHILGAAVTGSEVALTDIGVTIPAMVCPGVGEQLPQLGGTLTALSTSPWLNGTSPVTVNSILTDTAINQVVTSPESNLAFITYTNSGGATGAQLPYYVPNPSATSSAPQAGTVGYIPLTGSAVTAPVAGAFSPDDQYFFVSTAGDNKIHYISVPLVTSNPAAADTKQISPNLPACTPGANLGCTYSGSGTVVPATVITVKPRATT